MVSSRWSHGIAAMVLFVFLGVGARDAHASALLFGGVVRTISTGQSITLSLPSALVVDPAGDIFIADTSNNQIVEVNAHGAPSVFMINGLTPATLSAPSGIAIDAAGNLYIADTGNARVVKVSPSGAGSTISTGSVTLTGPHGVALDQSGDLFISDGIGGSSKIVEVTSGGVAAALTITVSPALNTPKGLAVDGNGTLYIADYANNRIVTVPAGSTTGSVFSTGGLEPGLSHPSSVAVDRIGNVYIADTSHSRIVGVDTSHTGTNLANFLTDQALPLSASKGVAVDAFGGVYIADTDNNQVLVVDPGTDWDPDSGEGYTSSLNKTAVGLGHISLGSSTPTFLTVSFTIGSPLLTNLGGVNVFTSGTQGLDFQIVSGANTTCNSSIESDSSCTVEVSFLPTAPGLRNGQLVLYDPNSNPVLTVPLYGFGDAPVATLAPNTGTAINTGGVPLSIPFQIALDGAGNIYDANDGGSLPGNLVKIAAGGGSASVVSPTGYPFGNEVTGVALDGAGNLFASDHDNNRILVITPGGVASVLTITGLSPTLSLPTALVFDASGTLYIADYGNGRTVEVSSIQVTGSTSTGIGTVIGTGSYAVSSEGNTGVAVDGMGNIYITDGYLGSSDPSRIIKVTPAGVASLLTPTGITFNSPQGVGVDAMGNIYVVDSTASGSGRIVEITAAGVASVLNLSGVTPTALSSPFGVTVDPFGNLYIPDSGNGRIVFVNVSGSALSYANTLEGQTSSDSPKTATVTNLGNQPLVFSANPTYTVNFSSNGNDTNPCTSSTSLFPGIACDVSINFTPQSVGSLSAGITVTNNALNVAGSTQQVSVSGTGLVSSDSTSTIVTTSPTSLVSGQLVTLTATVSDTATGHTSQAPTGLVTFSDTVGTTVTSLNNGAAVSLNNKTASLTGVVLSGIGTHTITAVYAGSAGLYSTSVSVGVGVSLGKASVTVTGPATQPVSVTPGQPGSAIITVTAPYTTIAAPSGGITYTLLNASGTSVSTATLPLTVGNRSSTASVPVPSTLAPGSYTISIVYSGDGNYASTATATIVSLQVSILTPTITWTPASSSIAYGTALGTLLNASAHSGAISVPGAFTYKAALNGGTTVTVNSASILAAGSYILTATFTPADTTTYAAVTAQVPLIISQLTPRITLTSSASSVVLTNPLVFTATVSSPAAAPTGTVTFLDGTTPLGQGTLSNGVATLSTSSLAEGSHTITVVYSGDANFSAATSGALTEEVLNFSLNNAGGSGGSGPGASQTVAPGGTASYPLSILPTNGTIFPAPITLSITGLPPGATTTIAPSSWTQLSGGTSWLFPANIAVPATTLTIQTPSTVARLAPETEFHDTLPPIAVGLLLLPLVSMRRRLGKTLGRTIFTLFLLLAGASGLVGLSGCGANSGFFGQPSQTYTMTVTATSGSLSHATTITLTLQ
jgi:sugar lactone lactonase YvrE